MEKYFREPINGITHLIGAVLSLIGLIFMIIKVHLNNGSLLEYSVAFIFGISMILLYLASSTYHSVISSDAVIKKLKRLDHSMIFVLIAGSYAPPCLLALHNKAGYILFGIVAATGILGIIFKMLWITCPKWVSSFMYITIGWFAIFAFYPLSKALNSAAMFLLILGGVLYTIGGVIYAIKSDKIRIGAFGGHEIFHIFIMLGSLCHFICFYTYIL